MDRCKKTAGLFPLPPEALQASSCGTQLGVSGKTPPELGSLFSPPATPPEPAESAIDLAEHDIERAEDRGDVRKHVAEGEIVHRLQMRKGRRADLALYGRFVPS